MERKIILSVLDPKGLKVCELYDSQCRFIGQAQDLQIDYSDGELTELSFTLPLYISDDEGRKIENPRWEYIKNEYRVLYSVDGKEDVFNIKIPEEEHKGSKVSKKVTCLHKAEQLKRRGLTANYVAEIGNARYHMERALRNTGWSIAEADTFYEEDLFDKPLTVTSDINRTPTDMSFGAYAEVRGATGSSTWNSDQGWVNSKITVTSMGKNLCDGMIEQGGLDEVTGLPAYNDSASRYRSINYMRVKPFAGKAITLVVSGNYVGSAIWHFYDETRKRTTWRKGSSTIVIPDGAYYMKYELLRDSAGSANFVLPPSEVQIEIGSQPTAYEKYAVPYKVEFTLGQYDSVDRNRILRQTNYDDSTHTCSRATEATVDSLLIYSAKLYKNGYIFAETDGGTEQPVSMVYTVTEGYGGTLREKYRCINKQVGTSSYDELRTIADVFGGKLLFDGKNMTVSLKKQIGRDTHMSFKPGYNTASVKRARSTTEIVTRLFVTNQQSEVGYIGIEEVNPIGTNFILNFDYYKELGILTAAHQSAIDTFEQRSAALSAEYKQAYDIYTHYSNSINQLVGRTPMGMAPVVSISGNNVTLGKAIYYDGGEDPEEGNGLYLRNVDGVWEKYEVATFMNGSRTVSLTKSPGSGSIAWWMSRPAAGIMGARIVTVDSKRTIYDKYFDKKQEIDEALNGAELTDKERENLQEDADAMAEKMSEVEAEIIKLSNGDSETVGLNQYFAQLVAEIDAYNTAWDSVEEINAQKKVALDAFEIAMGEMLHDGILPSGDYASGQELALYEDACEHLTTFSKPQAEYNVDGVDRSAYGAEYMMERLMFGDIVYMDEPELGIYNITAEVTRYTDMPMKKGSSSFVVSNFKEKPVELFEKIVKNTEEVEINKKKYDAAADILDENGNIKAELIKRSLESSGVMSEISLAGNQSLGDALVVQLSGTTLDGSTINWTGIGNLEAEIADIVKATIKYAEIDAANIINLSADFIAAGSITSDKIAAGSITSEHIKTYHITADNATIDAGVIGTSQIADGSITAAKIVSLNADVINAGTLAAERIMLKGNNGLYYQINATSAGLTTEQLSNSQYQEFINGTVIVKKSITADQIAAKSITANEILAGTITSAEINVTELFASEATINALNTADIRGNHYLKLAVDAAVETVQIGGTQILRNTRLINDSEDELMDWDIIGGIVAENNDGFGIATLE